MAAVGLMRRQTRAERISGRHQVRRHKGAKATEERRSQSDVQLRHKFDQGGWIEVMSFPWWIPLVAAACGALAGGIVAWLIEFWRRRRDSASLLRTLYAELLHIREHYGYAVKELPATTLEAADDPVAWRCSLIWAKYGELGSVSDFQRYGFVDAQEIQFLLQISLRIRNTDSLLDLLLENPGDVTISHIRRLAARMLYVIRSTDQLLHHLVKKRPAFQAFRDAIEQEDVGSDGYRSNKRRVKLPWRAAEPSLATDGLRRR